MKKSIGIALIVGFVTIFPSVSHAFKLESAEAYRLDAHTALFVLAYEYGFLNADLWMPMQAGEQGDTDNFRVHYELSNGDGAALPSTNAGVVLSTATLERFNDTYRYSVVRGERGDFMLVALVNTVAPLPDGATLKVIGLPFVLDKTGNKKESQQTGESVLEAYTASLKN